MSYTHVYLKKDNAFHCAVGSNCMRYKVTVAKKTVSTSLCPHEHIATALAPRQELSGEIPLEQSASKSKPRVKFNESQWMKNTSEFLYVHKKLDMSKSKKKLIEKKILKLNVEGWPKLYEPSEEKCPRCCILLKPPKRHPGMFSLSSFRY